MENYNKWGSGCKIVSLLGPSDIKIATTRRLSDILMQQINIHSFGRLQKNSQLKKFNFWVNNEWSLQKGSILIPLNRATEILSLDPLKKLWLQIIDNNYRKKVCSRVRMDWSIFNVVLSKSTLKEKKIGEKIPKVEKKKSAPAMSALGIEPLISQLHSTIGYDYTS